MRNEIYNQIKQSKIKYYAELKRREREMQINEAEVHNKETGADPKKSEQQETKVENSLSYLETDMQKVSLNFKQILDKIQFSKIRSIKDVICITLIKSWIKFIRLFRFGWLKLKHMTFLVINSRMAKALTVQITKFHSKLKKVDEKINERIDVYTDEIATRIYNSSVGLFEDKSDESGEMNSAPFQIESSQSATSVEWSFHPTVHPVYKLQERIASMKSVFETWIKRKNLYKAET
jgi:hypothetical protein